MVEKVEYRSLKQDEINTLVEQGCSARDWKQVQVEEGFNPVRIRNTHFTGDVRIGVMDGNVRSGQGLEKISGIFNAYIADCTIGNNVRIANVGVHIAGYDICAGACIENVGTIETTSGAKFGNGVEVEVLNEGGGREVILFDELSAQFAYILCLHRYRPEMTKKLLAMAKDYASRISSNRGRIAPGARICSTTEMINVNVGTEAVISGASRLMNGTILSSQDAITTVGAEVVAEDFIIAEGSSVTDGAILSKTFVGQGCQMGKQYSAENSLFFANCEAFHGEACSIFAGPYTVTHHKSTLLIAGLFSFYNAGSGSNQSNHMYKLGPVHEGKLARGGKTGSFSYMMWPCELGPFSVVLGKHTGTFDTSEFPFSHVEAKSDGKAMMVPGLYLSTVGTVRDGKKWPQRDRRKGQVKRDIITFDVFSPYTVGKMIKANRKLKALQESTDKSIAEITINGAQIKRVLLRTGQKFYRAGIEIYLLEKVMEKAEQGLKAGTKDFGSAFATEQDSVYSQEWIDIAGQLMPRDRLSNIEEGIENGEIKDIDAIHTAFSLACQAYGEDEWAWVKNAYKEVFADDLNQAGKEEVIKIAEAYLKARGKFIKLIIADAGKEFDELSHSGFGQDGEKDDVDKDFSAVRGNFDGNSFVKDMRDELAALEERVKRFKETAAQC